MGACYTCGVQLRGMDLVKTINFRVGPRMVHDRCAKIDESELSKVSKNLYNLTDEQKAVVLSALHVRRETLTEISDRFADDDPVAHVMENAIIDNDAVQQIVEEPMADWEVALLSDMNQPSPVADNPHISFLDKSENRVHYLLGKEIIDHQKTKREVEYLTSLVRRAEDTVGAKVRELESRPKFSSDEWQAIRAGLSRISNPDTYSVRPPTKLKEAAESALETIWAYHNGNPNQGYVGHSSL